MTGQGFGPVIGVMEKDVFLDVSSGCMSRLWCDEGIHFLFPCDPDVLKCDVLFFYFFIELLGIL